MLRNTRQIIRFPSKTVLADVLTRSTGYFDKDAYSPFRGMPELIDEQFKGSEREKFVLEDCISYNYAGDLNPARVKIQDEEDGFDTNDKVLAGWVTLEDMFEHEEEARLWFSRQLIGYKIHSDSPYNTETSYDTYMVGAGDDKDDEKELLEEREDFDLEKYNKILNEIPYLLKIIYKKSKEMRAHLLSFTRAYAILTSKGKSKSQIQPKDFDNFTLWRIKANGVFDRTFDHEMDNRGEHYPAARNFILGYHGHDEAYKACMKLISYYEYLGINWFDENPTIYDNRFMERLICTYLPSNGEYFEKYGQLDAEVVAALQPENIFKLGDRVSFFNETDIQPMSRNQLLNYIKDGINLRKLLTPKFLNSWDKSRAELTLKFLEMWFSPNGQPISLRDRFNLIDGFFYTLKRALVVLPIEPLGKFNNVVPNVIFSIYGMVIILPDRFDEDVKYIPIEECIERLQKSRRGEPYDEGWYIL